MHFRKAIGAFAVAAVLATTAACGGGDDDGPATTSNPQVPDGAPFIDQDNLKFKPNELTVQAGEKVYFVNSETAIHTVTIDGENESGTMKKNDVFVWTFEDAGDYKITCDFHAKMKATITVEGSAVSQQ